MAKMKSIKVAYGTSIQLKGQWSKFYTEVEIEIENGDDTDKIKETAWNTCYCEIEKQIQDLINE